MSQRPTCAHCGAKYGRRDTKLVHTTWPAEQPMPDYEGTETCVKKHVISIKPPKSRGHYELWSGDWFKPYDPFCTLRCALRYARKAYQRTLVTYQRAQQ